MKRHSRVSRGYLRVRSVYLMLADAALLLLGITAATYLRWGLSITRPNSSAAFCVAGIAIAVQIVAGGVALYRYVWRIGSFEEFRALSGTVVITAAAAVAADLLWFRDDVPFSAAVGGMALAFIGMISLRAGARLFQARRVEAGKDTQRTIVFGAGEVGRQLVEALSSGRVQSYWPVAILDDDPGKRSLRVRNFEVEGGRNQIASVARRHGATLMIIATPSAEAPELRELSDLASAAGLEVKSIPGLARLLDGPVGVQDVQPITEEELLGRRRVDLEIESIAGYLEGKCVLVTGAGGSIGSELCRQIHRFKPSSLVMLDRDESGLHKVQLSLVGSAMLDGRDTVVCDIRDVEALAAVFAEHRPDVVFHAAALKHLPLLETWPLEAFKTNVLGTLNVLEAASATGVKTLVNISTDKAADPVSILGYSKRIAERLTSGFAEHAGQASFMSVRFGNVIGSRGSVLETFRGQIAAGRPITVTHPEITRYFMMIEEAAQLVIQAGAIGSSGEVLILDMGEPVRIDEVARAMLRRAGMPEEVIYTGLRPGEKLHEDLLGDHEKDAPSSHSLITTAAVPPLEPVAVLIKLPCTDKDLRRHLVGLAAVYEEQDEVG